MYHTDFTAVFVHCM